MAAAVAAAALGGIAIPLSLDFLSGFGWATSLLANRKASYPLEFQARYLIDQRPVTPKESVQGEIDFNR